MTDEQVATGASPIKVVLLSLEIAVEDERLAAEVLGAKAPGSSSDGGGDAGKEAASDATTTADLPDTKKISLMSNASWTGFLGDHAEHDRSSVTLESKGKEPSVQAASCRMGQGAPEGKQLRWRLHVDAPKLGHTDESSGDAVYVGVGRASLGSPAPEIPDAVRATVVELATGRVLADGKEGSGVRAARRLKSGAVAEFVLDMTPKAKLVADEPDAAATAGDVGEPAVSAEGGEATGGAAAGVDAGKGGSTASGSAGEAKFGRLWMRTAESKGFELVDGGISTEYARFPCVFLRTSSKVRVRLVTDGKEDLSKIGGGHSASGKKKSDERMDTMVSQLAD